MIVSVTDFTLAEIARAARNVLGRPVTITPQTDIARDLNVDSLALMNIVMELEDAFDVSIPLDRLASVQTACDLATLVTELRERV
jgi:acyl carrier protein